MKTRQAAYAVDSRARAREAGRSHLARRKATRPVAPGISPRKSKRSLGKQRCFGGGRVRFSVIANTVTFTGRRLDDETGLFYYRNRYYHAQLGRFVSRDPIGYEGSEWNLYEYVQADPIRRTDPEGKDMIGPLSDDSLVIAMREDTWRKERDRLLAKFCAGIKCPCCSEAECRKRVRKLLDAAHRQRPRSDWYVVPVNVCQNWVFDFESASSGGGKCFSQPALAVFEYRGFPYENPITGTLRHCALKVTMCDGASFYLDSGWWGGVFLPEDIPDGVDPMD